MFPRPRQQPAVYPPMPICIFLLLLVFYTGEAASDLDCDFQSECCWEGDGLWTVKQKHRFNINEFRKTFLVGRSRQPPAGNYILRESFGEDGHYYSCPFCSTDGTVLVQFRHWQSPTARLHICYKTASQLINRECQLASTSKQSQVSSYVFRVPRAQKIQLVFLSETTEASMGSGTIMIDAIKVQYQDCHAPVPIPKAAIPPRPKARNPQPVQAANKTIEDALLRRNSQLSEAVYKKFSPLRKSGMKKVKQIESNAHSRPAKVPTRLSVSPKPTMAPTVPPPPAPQRPPISIPSGRDFNPLNDLLGEQLANFLDPDYVTNDKEEPEEIDEVPMSPASPMKAQKVPTHGRARERLITDSPKAAVNQKQHTTVSPAPVQPAAPTQSQQAKLKSGAVVVLPRKPVQVNRPAPLSELQRPLPIGVPLTCNTPGGCLFEQGFCSWKAPTEVPTNAQFQLSKVGPSTFIQAKVPSGEVSIIQVDTQLNENHTVVFDVLEWQTGSRLIGCCFVQTNLHCPFATPSEQGALLWQMSKFECPSGTDKILFICENYGQEEAICGVDNVRLHKSTDIFFIEPCQKNSLSSL